VKAYRDIYLSHALSVFDTVGPLLLLGRKRKDGPGRVKPGRTNKASECLCYLSKFLNDARTSFTHTVYIPFVQFIHRFVAGDPALGIALAQTRAVDRRR
jgi:hypothetical protein